jgi:hypothetical protein
VEACSAFQEMNTPPPLTTLAPRVEPFAETCTVGGTLGTTGTIGVLPGFDMYGFGVEVEGVLVAAGTVLTMR